MSTKNHPLIDKGLCVRVDGDADWPELYEAVNGRLEQVYGIITGLLGHDNFSRIGDRALSANLWGAQALMEEAKSLHDQMCKGVNGIDKQG